MLSLFYFYHSNCTGTIGLYIAQFSLKTLLVELLN